jgi:putative nucleotidyltransferase with HDIG domain
VQLYPSAHPAFGESLDALVGAVREATGKGPLVLNWHKGRLYADSSVLADDVHGHGVVAEAFELRHIESLSFHATFGPDDALGLVEVLSMRTTPEIDVAAELERRSVASVTVSVLADEHDPEREERDRRRQADRALYRRTIAALRRLQERFSAQGGDLGDTPELVGHIMERLLAEPSSVLALATIGGTSERGLFHSLNVMIYALALGQRLGLPDEGLASLGLSALLHDIGKTAFDADDPAQVEAMREMHTRVGAEILQRAAVDDPAPMLVAYEHHMHADGTGWPDRPSDYVTHPYSRMVAIADRYENLTNPTDPNALTPDKALVTVLNETVTRLDPFFARLFAGALGAFPVGCLVRLTDHGVGVVCRAGDDPLAPVVRLAYDGCGRELDSPDEVDLSSSEVRIVEVISPSALNVAVAEKL